MKQRHVEVGICTKLEHCMVALSTGADYVEIPLRDLYSLTHKEIQVIQRKIGRNEISIACGNCLFPRDFNILPRNDQRLSSYLSHVLYKAKLLGITTIVFGSPASRIPPFGVDRAAIFHMMIDVVQRVADLAHPYGMQVAIEPDSLSSRDPIPSLASAYALVTALGDPTVGIVFDTYHTFRSHEISQSSVVLDKRYMRYVTHVHVNDPVSRGVPQGKRLRWCKSVLTILQQNGYMGSVSLECGDVYDCNCMKAAVDLLKA